MASKKTTKSQGSLPFGAGAVEGTDVASPPGKTSKAKKAKKTVEAEESPSKTKASVRKKATKATRKRTAEPADDAAAPAKPIQKKTVRRSPARQASSVEAPAQASDKTPRESHDAPSEGRREPAQARAPRNDHAPRNDSKDRDESSSRDGGRSEGGAPASGEGSSEGSVSRREGRRRRWQDRRTRRKRRKGRGQEGGGPGDNRGDNRPDARGDGRVAPRGQGSGGAPATSPEARERSGGPRSEPMRDKRPVNKARSDQEVEGILLVEKANHGHLRSADNDYLPKKDDVHVPPRLVQKYMLGEGALLRGRARRGQGRHKWELHELTSVDGEDPSESRHVTRFKQLTSIDPDFHYAVGDGSGEVSLRVLDLICPVGRGQRGLIVAPPRTGKTILMQQFAKAIETIYPEVELMVLLIDERPEEATEWKRSTKGQVFVSTNDEMAKRHVELAEVVWKRCQRLVELGKDVILLLDSITRLGRAYNNVKGNSGKTMSGGIDTRALERPKQFFGSARNTETAGSLTILGTTLIETGSRMDQVIFEEFKGTGNMELVLSRKLADRRIFPAIDIQKSGTRKDEKLISSQRLKLINTLRRVLLRMHFAEAMELLISKLCDVERTDDFLNRFEVDPEA